ncbi:MAG: flagellar brake protein [Treponema sp.]|jgi:c-di-GMP-binding flagellar brake protein YcgR|nr:flagellar brake protein [Treponema sp.]
MKCVLTGIHLNLLQDNIKYFKDDDPTGAIILLSAIGAIIVLSIAAHAIRHGLGVKGTAFKGGAQAANPRNFNIFTMRRIASAYGLDKDQSRLLEFVFRNAAVGDPERIMQNGALLDRHFKRAYKAIERSAETEEEAQVQLSQLFSLRNVIEAAPISNGTISTYQLSENTAAVLSTGKDSFPLRVISSKGDSIVVEVPRNALGTPIQIPKGTKVTLSFFTKSSKGFAFDSRVLGSIETTKGPGLQLAHSGKAKALSQRRYRRRAIRSGCVFYFVFIDTVKEGRKKTPKLFVDSRRYTGTILDISIGGCSVKTSAPVQVGSRLKLEIDYSDDSNITVLAQVLRSNRSGSAGTVIHLKFLKVPRRAFNNINAVVFGFDED